MENAGSILAEIGRDPRSTNSVIWGMLYPGAQQHKEMAARALMESAGVDINVVAVQSHLTASEYAKKAETRSDTIEHEAAGLTGEVSPYCVASIQWARLGYPVIDLVPDFFHAIAVTDFGQCDKDELRLPFDAFVLRFPENVILDGARSTFVYRRYRLAKKEDSLDVNWGRYRATLANTKDNCRWFTDFDDGAPMHRFLTGKARQGAVGIVPPENPERAAEILAVLRRIIGNTVIYISNEGGLPAKKRLGPDVPVEKEHNEHPRFRVGRPIHLGPKIRSVLAVTAPRFAGWRLMHRFIVRGHWRSQACGPRMTERRRTWIQPFWKGPVSTIEAIERAYVVE